AGFGGGQKSAKRTKRSDEADRIPDAEPGGSVCGFVESRGGWNPHGSPEANEKAARVSRPLDGSEGPGGCRPSARFGTLDGMGSAPGRKRLGTGQETKG